MKWTLTEELSQKQLGTLGDSVGRASELCPLAVRKLSQ